MTNPFKSYEYDVAFSFGNDNLGIAESIAKALATLQIKYFLYTEHTPENAGRPLIDVTMEIYAGGLSRYVLEIRDEHYGKSFWSRVEHLLAERYDRNRKVYIIKLMLNEEAVDQGSKDVIYLKWNENPHETAIIIAAKLAMLEKKRKKVRLFMSFGLAISIVISLSFFFYFQNLFSPKANSADSVLKNIGFTHSPKSGTTIIQGPKPLDNKAMSVKPPVIPVAGTKNQKKGDEITISGIITDEKGILLDSAMVVLNNVIAYSKSGYYSITYHTKQFGSEYSIALSFHFSKPGYESKSSNLSRDINPDNKEFDLGEISLNKL